MNRSSTKPTVIVGIADKQPAILDYARKEAERAACDLTPCTVPAATMGSMYSIEVPEAYRAAGREVLAAAARY